MSDKPVNQLPETVIEADVNSTQRLVQVINKLVRSVKALDTEIEQLRGRVESLENP